MSGWAEKTMLGFDTETTGVHARQDRIVTAALVQRSGERTETRSWLLDPGVAIPAEASGVHGVTTARARAEGRPAAAGLEEIASCLAEALRRGTPVVAFNAIFDLTILEHELARHGLPGLAARLGSAPRPVLDPLVLDRALDPDRPGPRRLADVCARYEVRASGPMHTAEADAAVTLDVLSAMARRHPAVAAMPAEQLHVWQATVTAAWRARRRLERDRLSASSSGPPPSSGRRAGATPSGPPP